MKGSHILKKKPKKFKNIYKNTLEAEAKAEVKGRSDLLVKNNNYDLLFGLIPLAMLLVFLAIYYINFDINKNINQLELKPLSLKVALSPYPIIDRLSIPEITADSAIIYDTNSKVVVYSKNPDLRFSMASTAKIMTALTAMDFYNEKSILTILSPSIEGSNSGFSYGEKFYFKDLLYAMFLPSSNEAAFAIAQNYPGGIDSFVRAMNEKASDMRLYNTHFKDPAGLNDDQNFTTVKDLSNLASLAVRNEILAEITSTKRKVITNADGSKDYQLTNLNKLLGVDGVNGIKTGTTTGAGEVLVTSKVESGHTFIIIVMKSEQRYTDTKSLISLISNKIRYIVPEYSGSKVKSLVINK